MLKKIIHSIFPGLSSSNRREETSRFIFKSLVFHFRPRTVNARTLDFNLTFGLGGMAFILILLLFGTGLLMKFYYSPFPGRAYESIINLRSNVLFGSLIRNIHYWSANILIIVAFLHFLRVFFTSAFHSSRQFNWVIGLFLFLVILTFNFTGYLLPWDQLSYWAVTICTGMMDYIPLIGKWMQTAFRGGAEVGESTLTVFYSAHTALLPAILILVIPFHFWRVRRAGGLVVPPSKEGERDASPKHADTFPNLFLREFTVALVLIAVILFISIFFDAPLGDEANPGLSPNPTKAPWYFMGFQEILLHLHPLMAIFVIPFLIVLGLLSIAYTKYRATREGIWFVSAKGRSMAAAAVVIALVLTCVLIIADEYIIDFNKWVTGMNPVIINGMVPFCSVLLLCLALYLFLIKKYSPDKNEKILVVFVFFLTVFAVLTVTGIWFRGSGMKLVWPF